MTLRWFAVTCGRIRVIIYDSRPNTGTVLFWNDHHQVAWGFCSVLSYRLCRLFTPFLVNVVSAHTMWYKKSGSSPVVCRNHWQKWRQILLFIGCSPCTSCMWKRCNCSWNNVPECILKEAFHMWPMKADGLACKSSYTSLHSAHFTCCNQCMLVTWIHLSFRPCYTIAETCLLI
jgi:hypothetical protein